LASERQASEKEASEKGESEEEALKPGLPCLGPPHLIIKATNKKKEGGLLPALYHINKGLGRGLVSGEPNFT
jgi:hypothetical protein